MSARPGEHAGAAGRAASRSAPAPARAARLRPWRDCWQLVPVALLMYALVAVDRFRRGPQAAGLVNAVTINRLNRHPVPAAAAHMVLQVLVSAAARIWLFGSGHPSFRLYCDALIVTGVIGLMAFWVYPGAPPRMLPGYHDTVDAIGPLFSHQLETKAADALAAFPSLHVTWALWVAVVCQALVRRRIWRAAVWAYPAATTIDVLATANHYALDAITAPAVLAVGYAAAASPVSCPPCLAAGSSPNRAAGGSRGALLRGAADARTARPWSAPGRPARPGIKPASARPRACAARRTPQAAAGHGAIARSPPGPGVTGPAVRHGCGPAPFLARHERRGAMVIARRRNEERNMSSTRRSPTARTATTRPRRPSRRGC
jgi:hypothetical protein